MLKTFPLVNAGAHSFVTRGKMENTVAHVRVSEDRDLPCAGFCYSHGLQNKPSAERMCLAG